MPTVRSPVRTRVLRGSKSRYLRSPLHDTAGGMHRVSSRLVSPRLDVGACRRAGVRAGSAGAVGGKGKERKGKGGRRERPGGDACRERGDDCHIVSDADADADGRPLPGGRGMIGRNCTVAGCLIARGEGSRIANRESRIENRRAAAPTRQPSNPLPRPAKDNQSLENLTPATVNDRRRPSTPRARAAGHPALAKPRPRPRFALRPRSASRLPARHGVAWHGMA